MLGVQDIYALRHKVLVEGKSQRQVAREMGLARDTVRRYLATPLPEPRKRKRPRPVLEQVRPRLEQLVEEWSERTTAKQRITGRRLQRALREEGYEVGLTLVLEYLREWRRERAEVYVPLVHRPGESARRRLRQRRRVSAGSERDCSGSSAAAGCWSPISTWTAGRNERSARSRSKHGVT